MYRGEALYRDFFEYTFPGTQVIYFALLNLFGTKFWVINLVIFAQAIAQTVLGLAISRVLFGNSWYAFLPPSLFLFFGFRWFGIDGSHRMLSPIFIYLAILILLKSRSRQRIIIAGICCGVASFFTQQRGILAIAAIALFLLIEVFKNKGNWKNWLVDELVLGGSFILTLGVLLLPFIISAGPSTFFDYTVVYIRYYVQEPTANYGVYRLVFERLFDQGAQVSLLILFYLTLIPFIYIIAIVYLWRKEFRIEALLVCLVGTLLAFGTFAPAPGRLFQISLPGLIILVWLVYQIKLRWDFPVKVAVTLLVIFGAILGLRLQTWEKFYLDSPTGRLAFLSAIQAERYKWLSENTANGEYVFEVYQTAINFPLQLPNPTRITFLLDNGYTPEWQVSLAIKDLEDKRPRFIIWDGKWNKEPQERNADDHLASLYEYLRQNYEMQHAFTPYSKREMQAWKRKIE